ncbi:hypothetical protein C41B8_15170 [Salinisphaera hydrothermalis C41B8]|uniref:Uncharacterized protein n=1 Tax=Salinisphaera hydrothermalis (strain C41B8) TaxID=1304275 RepID=A0A084II32_SALHC|nr:hypothetical protein C41B8_15170 [Salinisphaera hydrothermalis C41B8]
MFTVVCPNPDCGQAIDRSAWWLLQREAYSACPACGADMAKAIDEQRMALCRDGYADAEQAREMPIAS